MGHKNTKQTKYKNKLKLKCDVKIEKSQYRTLRQ